MARYLSVYKMRAVPLPDGRKERDEIRTAALRELKKSLGENNPYIRALENQQLAKHRKNHMPYHQVKQINRDERRAERRDARKIHGHVNNLFTELDYLKRQKSK